MASRHLSGFRGSVRIRPLERPYSYERGELASALAGLLKDAKLAPALVPGVNNRFLDSLVKGEIENFGSHFQDGPYGDGSPSHDDRAWDATLPDHPHGWQRHGFVLSTLHLPETAQP